MKRLAVILFSCLLHSISQAQFLEHDTLQGDGKYVVWFDVAAGPDIYAAHPVLGLKMYAEANFELFNGIITAKAGQSLYPYITLYNTSEYRDYAILYGVYKKNKNGVTLFSAGLSYAEILKVKASEDNVWGYETLSGSLPGISFQATRWLTFGAGPGLGIGISTNINTFMPTAAVVLNFGFGIFKWNDTK